MNRRTEVKVSSSVRFLYYLNIFQQRPLFISMDAIISYSSNLNTFYSHIPAFFRKFVG